MLTESNHSYTARNLTTIKHKYVVYIQKLIIVLIQVPWYLAFDTIEHVSARGRL